MRHVITIILSLFSVTAFGQTLETAKEGYPTGYVNSNYFSPGNTIMSIDGVLYMAASEVPTVLLRYPAMNERTEFEVPSTVRRIANNAFQGTKHLKTLKLHNTVTYGKYVQIVIGETAFNDSSIENFIVIEDDGAYNDVKSINTNRNETARYDVSGRTTTNDADGVQIIKYDDHSSAKVLNKK